MAQDFTVDRDSVKRVLHSDGYLKTYAVDEPAFEFKDDGSYRGVLIEPTATNICQYSEAFGSWGVGVGALVNSDVTTAPDNTTTADRIIDDNGGGTSSIQVLRAVTVTAEEQYTFSVFLKADQLSFASLAAIDYDGTNDASMFFGLSGDGTLGADDPNLDDYKIEKYPNGWYRCSITWTQGVGDTSTSVRIYVADSISNLTVDRDSTSSIFAWGAQVEQGPIATSYIPTTTASVTRNADNITMTGASSLIGQTEGTLFVEVEWRLASGEDQRLLGVNDGTSDNRVLIVKNTSNQIVFLVSLSGSSTALDVEDASSYSGDYKFALAYKSTDNAVYVNGSTLGALSNNPSISFGATLTDVELGQTAGNQANMWIKSVALFTRRLTDTELAALTS